jgi:hypothetical protein
MYTITTSKQQRHLWSKTMNANQTYTLNNLKTLAKRDIIRELIKNTNGKFFSTTFIKIDSSVRKMVPRIGVKKGQKGGVNTLALKLEYVNVWDSKVEGYRAINMDTMIEFKCGAVHRTFLI